MDKKKKKILWIIAAISIFIIITLQTVLIIVLLGKDENKEDNVEGNLSDGVLNNGNEDAGNTSGGDGEETVNGLYLIKNSKALFGVVYSSGGLGCEKEASEKFISRLRALGVSVGDAEEDSDTDIRDCEIIIGAGANLRGNDFNISIGELGPRGYIIKSAGNKILIAGGSEEYLNMAIDKFFTDVLGVSSNTEVLSEFCLAEDIFIEKLTEYKVNSVSVANNDLAIYTLIFEIDEIQGYESENILNFKEDLFSNTGYLLPVYSGGLLPEYSVIIRCTDDAGEDGFRVFVSGEDLIIECSYHNKFDAAFKKFADNELFQEGDINFGSDYLYTDRVCDIYYSDFGAAGDGITDDYKALYEAHTYANACGQSVYADDGAVYLIKDMIYGSIPVMTDVYLGNARIIADNKTEDESGSLISVFSIESSYTPTKYYSATDSSLFEYLDLLCDQPYFSCLFGVSGNNLVKVYGYKNGISISDVFIIDENTKIDTSSPVAFNFDSLTKIEVYSLDDENIVFSGGEFGVFESRNLISVRRSNVLLEGINYKAEDGADNLIPTVSFSLSYNCEVDNSDFAIVASSSINMKFSNIGEKGENAPFILLDGAKNVEISGSVLKALDASPGVFGLKVFNSDIDEALKLCGGGVFEASGVKVEDENAFILLPRESGASFRGDIIIKNSELISEGTQGAYVIKSEFDFGDSDYMTCEFGYKLYMPENIYMDNFTFGDADICLFSPIEDSAFEEGKYIITESVTYENMHTLDMSRDIGEGSLLFMISVFNETYPRE